MIPDCSQRHYFLIFSNRSRAYFSCLHAVLDCNTNTHPAPNTTVTEPKSKSIKLDLHDLQMSVSNRIISHKDNTGVCYSTWLSLVCVLLYLKLTVVRAVRHYIDAVLHRWKKEPFVLQMQNVSKVWHFALTAFRPLDQFPMRAQQSRGLQGQSVQD